VISPTAPAVRMAAGNEQVEMGNLFVSSFVDAIEE
jgi:hypothetical protein